MKESLEQLIEHAGLASRKHELLPLALPAVRFSTEPTDSVALGGSRVGGSPDVPADFPWPEFEDVPLAFIAQLNLADFAGHLPPGLLPAAGSLVFFNAANQQNWGFDPADRGSAVIVYFEPDAPLAPRPLPLRMPDEGRFSLCRIANVAGVLTLPGYDSPLLEPLALSEEESDRYFDQLLESLDGADGELYHQLCGHAGPVQNDMLLECQLVTNGLNCGGPEGYQDPRRAELEEGQYDWRLLLQVESDDNASMMWGDVGRLYYWMRRQDLAARRFGDSWLILQCS